MHACTDMTDRIHALAMAKLTDPAREESGLKWTSVPLVVFQKGVVWLPAQATREEAAYMGVLLTAHRARRGRSVTACDPFFAAQSLVLLDAAGAVDYAEGYRMTAPDVLVLHAWVSLNGKLFDPAAWGPSARRLPQQLGVVPPGWTYFGVVVPRWAVEERLATTGTMKPLLPELENSYGAFGATPGRCPL